MQNQCITVVDTVDNPDGTVTLTFEISEASKTALIQYALRRILEDAAEEEILSNKVDNQQDSCYN